MLLLLSRKSNQNHPHHHVHKKVHVVQRRLRYHHDQYHHRLLILFFITELYTLFISCTNHYHNNYNNNNYNNNNNNQNNIITTIFAHTSAAATIGSSSTTGSTNNNNVIVIPFWNVAARRQQQRYLKQLQQQQQQDDDDGNIDVEYQKQEEIFDNHDDHYDDMNHSMNYTTDSIDYCIASSSLRKLDSILQRNQQQQRKLTSRTISSTDSNSNSNTNRRNNNNKKIMSHDIHYRGGYISNDDNDQSVTTTTVSTDSDTSSTDSSSSSDDTSISITTTPSRVDDGYKPLPDHKNNKNKNTMYQFTLFQNGDGSDEDIEGIPQRYLLMHHNDRQLAKQSVLHTLQWRKDHNIDTIIQRPQIYYDIAKAVFPHYFVDVRDTSGHIVFIQRPALLNLNLASKNKLEPSTLLDHYIYVNEYLWQILEKDNALATMTSIIDLQGLNFKYLRQKEIVNFMKEFVKTMDHHYPQRANKTFIINAPKWFHVLYKIVSPLLRESTKSKIEIYTRSKRQDHALKTLLGHDKAETLLPESFFTKKKNKHTKNKNNDKKQMMMKTKDKDEDNDNTEPSIDETLDDGMNGNNNENKDDDNNNNDDDNLPPSESVTTISSRFETELREFTLQRIQEAGVKMLEVVPL